jgi:2C-methyl-D-erythritol 2,4-cyclodiphosphate synthase
MDREVQCVITGTTMIMGKDYFEKKSTEFGGADNLKRFYISRKAKQLLIRGYNVGEIRKILDINEPNLLPEDDPAVKLVVEYYKPSSDTNRRLESNLNFSMQNSDDDVVVFINNIINENKKI